MTEDKMEVVEEGFGRCFISQDPWVESVYHNAGSEKHPTSWGEYFDKLGYQDKERLDRALQWLLDKKALSKNGRGYYKTRNKIEF